MASSRLAAFSSIFMGLFDDEVVPPSCDNEGVSKSSRRREADVMPRGDDQTATLAEIAKLLSPISSEHRELIHAVQQASQHQPKQACGDISALGRAESLAQALSRAGYSVRIRRAVGGGEGAISLSNLRHTFLYCASSSNDSFIIDPSFREQFEIAKPTQRFTQVLESVPDLLVIPASRIAPLVTLLCEEVAIAFKFNAMLLPPWRQTHGMLSKWLPRMSMDESFPPSPQHSSPTGQLDRVLSPRGSAEMAGAWPPGRSDSGSSRNAPVSREASSDSTSRPPIQPQQEPALVAYGGFFNVVMS